MEGWSGKGEGSVLASRHPSWDEEEEGGGVWNSTSSQESCSSYNSGGWGHTQGGKRGTIKVGYRSVASTYSLRQATWLICCTVHSILTFNDCVLFAFILRVEEETVG